MAVFLIKEITFTNFVTIMINQLQQDLSKTCYFLRLILQWNRD